MNDDIRILLENSKKINSKTISLIRFLLLALLAYFVDGLQYREMKAALGISDGKLISNLTRLEVMGYIDKSVTKLERKEISVYSLTSKGKGEVKKIADWLNLIQKVIRVEK